MLPKASRAVVSHRMQNQALQGRSGAISTAVAHFLHTEGVTGSNPVSPIPTGKKKLKDSLYWAQWGITTVINPSDLVLVDTTQLDSCSILAILRAVYGSKGVVLLCQIYRHPHPPSRRPSHPQLLPTRFQNW